MDKPIALKHLVGDNIRSLRKSKDWSQEILGERAGLSYKFVGEVERGAVNPSLESLGALATALDVEVIRLFLRPGIVVLSDTESADVRAAIGTLHKSLGFDSLQ